jgi:thiosulfate reductase cytochrome b subunit
MAERAKLVSKHPLAIRWFHWINFPVLAIMIWSGLLIYWANDIYKVGDLVKMFPDWFYAPVVKGIHIHAAGDNETPLYELRQRLAEGMGWHFLFFWIFAINGLAYVLYTAFSGQWRFIVPNGRSAKEAFQVVLHDLRIRKQPLPRKKYNGAQQFAYTSVSVMGLLMLLTGVCMYKPVQFSFLTHLFGSYMNARFIHFWTTMAFVAFFLVHILQVIRAGWNNFRGMITGKEIVIETIPEAPVEA